MAKGFHFFSVPVRPVLRNFFLASILLACLLGSIFKAEAREVTPFNNGWEFKKGPFPTDAMQTAARWNADWEQVNVPHTWNADDMQKKTNSFYAGELIIGSTMFFLNHWKASVFFYALRV